VLEQRDTRTERKPEDLAQLFTTDQIPGASRYLIFHREGAARASHDHSETVAVLEGGADATDGLDATAEPLGPAFPRGLVVAMNDRRRNFLFFRPEDLGLAVKPSRAFP
jgi:myo-inositol-hexaphosphate 3-phosphohydrolase